MEFRDLKKQYEKLQDRIDQRIADVIRSGRFISGPEVKELEGKLAEYVGAKHCISCANGTDALTLACMAWKLGPEDAVFVPDFTFFSSGESPASTGAHIVFVDVEQDTYNMDPVRLEEAVKRVSEEGKYRPRVVVADSRRIMTGSGRSVTDMICYFWRTEHRASEERSGGGRPVPSVIFPLQASFPQSLSAVMGMGEPSSQMMMKQLHSSAVSASMERV